MYRRIGISCELHFVEAYQGLSNSRHILPTIKASRDQCILKHSFHSLQHLLKHIYGLKIATLRQQNKSNSIFFCLHTISTYLAIKGEGSI